MCFSESERDPRNVGLIGKKILKKGWGNGKKYWKQNFCVCVCVCVSVWSNSFDIIAIIFKAYKKCKSPIKKGF